MMLLIIDMPLSVIHLNFSICFPIFEDVAFFFSLFKYFLRLLKSSEMVGPVPTFPDAREGPIFIA